MGNYGAWTIAKKENGEAAATLNGNGTFVHLKKSDSILYEGLWGELSDKKTTCITGVCLMGGAWAVEFEKNGRGNPPALRSLSSIKDRADIEKRIKNGKKISKIFFPLAPNGYHHKLIPWIMKKISLIGAKRVLFHLPISEYVCFIKNFEELSGLHVPQINELFDNFVKQTVTLIESEVNAHNINLEFISPLEMGAQNEMESFGFPYFYPEKFGISADELFGVEDLCELKISMCAEEKIGHQIPVFAGVIDLPHPYLEKTIKGCEEITI